MNNEVRIKLYKREISILYLFTRWTGNVACIGEKCVQGFCSVTWAKDTTCMN